MRGTRTEASMVTSLPRPSAPMVFARGDRLFGSLGGDLEVNDTQDWLDEEWEGMSEQVVEPDQGETSENSQRDRVE